MIDRARDDGRGGSVSTKPSSQSAQPAQTHVNHVAAKQQTDTTHTTLASPKPSSDMTVIFTATYAFGDTGVHVEQLQQALIQL